MYSQNILYCLKLPCVYAQCMVNLIATCAVMWEMWDIFRKRKFRKWRLIWKSKAVHRYKAFLKNKWPNKSRKMFPIINRVNYYFITTKDIISSILTLHSEWSGLPLAPVNCCLYTVWFSWLFWYLRAIPIICIILRSSLTSLDVGGPMNNAVRKPKFWSACDLSTIH